MMWPQGVATPVKRGREGKDGLGLLENLSNRVYCMCSFMGDLFKIFLRWAHV